MVVVRARREGQAVLLLLAQAGCSRAGSVRTRRTHTPGQRRRTPRTVPRTTPVAATRQRSNATQSTTNLLTARARVSSESREEERESSGPQQVVQSWSKLTPTVAASRRGQMSAHSKVMRETGPQACRVMCRVRRVGYNCRRPRDARHCSGRNGGSGKTVRRPCCGQRTTAPHSTFCNTTTSSSSAVVCVLINARVHTRVPRQ